MKYSKHEDLILDENNKISLIVRGWGYLTGTGHGGNSLKPSDAARIQDSLVDSVLAILNNEKQPKNKEYQEYFKPPFKLCCGIVFHKSIKGGDGMLMNAPDKCAAEKVICELEKLYDSEK